MASLVGIAAVAGSLGVGDYVQRESARGGDARTLLRSVAPVLAGTGAVAAVAAPFVARGLDEHGAPAQTMLVIIFLLFPLTLPAGLLPSIGVGKQAWREVTAFRLIPPLGGLLSSTALFLLDRLTVVTILSTSIVWTAVAYMPLWRFGRGKGGVFSRRVTVNALRFGSRTWLGNLLVMLNQRLDQLVLVALATPRALGLYAVAVSVSTGVVVLVSSAVATAIQPRIAAGDFSIVAQAVRTTVCLMICLSALVALGSPFVLPLLFGREFSEAIHLLWVLLVASIPLSVIAILNPASVAAGHPHIPAMSEGVALLLSAPFLAVGVIHLGALGAALASTLSYAVSCALLLREGRAIFGVSVASMLVPRRSDMGVVYLATRSRWKRTR